MPLDDGLYRLPGPRDPARQLPGPLHPFVEREAALVLVAVLTLHLGPIDRAPVYSRWRPGLEARHCKSKRSNVLRNLDRRLITRPARRNRGIGPNVNPTPQERARRDDYSPRREPPPVGRLHPADLVPAHDEAGNHPLSQLEIAEALEQLPHGAAVQRAVALRARRPHRRPLGAVEHPELERRTIAGTAHETAQRVDLAHHSALRDPADRGIAGHLADGVEVGGDDQGARAEPGAHDGGFGSGVAGADDEHIVVERHGPIIGEERPRLLGRRRAAETLSGYEEVR